MNTKRRGMKMIDNGYVFAKDNKRVFLNTSLRCDGKCSYCYLSKMHYVHKRKKTAEEIIKSLEESPIEINQETLITIGCFSECLDEANKRETLYLVKYFLKRGNQVQLSTKKQILESDLVEIFPFLSYYGQLVIYISSATISKQNLIEPNTSPIQERFKSFALAHVYPIPIVLYVKPVLQGITIQDLALYVHYIETYKIKDVVVGSLFTTNPSDESVPFSNKQELFYQKNDDEDILISEFSKRAKVYRRSTEVLKNYKQKHE